MKLPQEEDLAIYILLYGLMSPLHATIDAL